MQKSPQAISRCPSRIDATKKDEDTGPLQVYRQGKRHGPGRIAPGGYAMDGWVAHRKAVRVRRLSCWLPQVHLQEAGSDPDTAAGGTLDDENINNLDLFWLR